MKKIIIFISFLTIKFQAQTYFAYPTIDTFIPATPPIVPCPGLLTCKSNIICNGNIESTTDPKIYGQFGFELIYGGPYSNNSVDIYATDSPLRVYQYQPFNPNPFPIIGGWNSCCCYSTPSNVKAPEGNQFIGFLGRGLRSDPEPGSNYSEAIHFKLNRELDTNKIYSLKFWARKARTSTMPSFQNCKGGFNLKILGSKTGPCYDSINNLTLGFNSSVYTPRCSYSALQSWDKFIDSSAIWKEYTLLIKPNHRIKNLVMTILEFGYNNHEAFSKYGYFDDFRLIEEDFIIKDSIVRKCASADVYMKTFNAIPPCTYLWNDGSSLQNRTNLPDGTYYITVTENNGLGCSQIDTVVVKGHDTLTGYISASELKCSNNSGALTFNNTSSAVISTYSWSPVSSSSSSVNITNLNQTYYVTVTTTNGCSKVFSILPNIDSPSYTKLGSAYNRPSYSPLKGNILSSNGVDANRRFRVGGVFTVNDAWDLKNTDIVMDAGAVIRYTPNGILKTLTLTNNVIYTCVDQLAKGIEINSGSLTRVNLINNRIQDCHKAIEFNTKIFSFTINGNNFDNNLIGIDFNLISPHQNSTIAHAALTGNSFQGKGINQLKNWYPMMTTLSQIPINYKTSYVGIRTINLNFLNIGALNSSINNFSTMTNGCIFNNGSHTIINTKFYNINQNGSETGYAIKAINTNNGSIAAAPASNLKITGLGNLFNSTPTFDSVGVPVYAYYGFSLDMKKSRINRSYYPVQYIGLKSNESRSLVIDSNYIFSKGNGLYITDHSSGNFSSQISNNTIKTSNGASIYYERRNVAGSNNNLNIRNNQLVCADNGNWGLYLTGLNHKGTVYNNKVTLNNPSKSIAGIHYQNCTKLLDTFNEVNSINRSIMTTISNYAPKSYYPVGILYEKSVGTFTCNYVNTIRTGIRFIGDCRGSDFRKNKINNHNTGLRLDYLSALGTQTRKGNTFSGSPSTCDTEAITRQITADLFYVANTNGTFMPNPKYPNTIPWWILITGVPTSQFENNFCVVTSSGANIVGTKVIGPYSDLVFRTDMNTFIPSDHNSQPIMDIELSSIDTSLLTNTMVFGDFEPQLLWQYRQGLYDKILPYLDQTNDTSIYRDFKDAMDNGTINEFSQILELERQAEESIDSVSIQMSQIQHQLTQAWDSIAIYDSLIMTTYDSTLLVIYQSYKSTQLSYISALNISLATLVTEDEDVRASLITNILAINDSIVPTGRADSLQRSFIDLYYHTIGTENDGLTPAQVESYQSLASHCPFENGNVVYRSRAIVRSIYDTIDYNDSALCASIGIELKSTKPDPYPMRKPLEISCAIYPNPSNGLFDLKFNQIPKHQLTFIVQDILGRELVHETKLLNTNNYKLDLSKWLDGYYLIKVLEGERTIHQSKLELIKK